ncbi:hypothetical protein SynBIOSE41_00823 [Synechococcus sp. BIOS-E4-1]|nr:hypothetical protein SynBIOSE41_00823 [Synechococcus sp. BIOS-E4-1]
MHKSNRCFHDSWLFGRRGRSGNHRINTSTTKQTTEAAHEHTRHACEQMLCAVRRWLKHQRINEAGNVVARHPSDWCPVSMEHW